MAAVVENSPAAAVLPLEARRKSCCLNLAAILEQALAGIPADAALVLTTFDGPQAESLSRGRKMQTAAGQPLETAVPAVDVSIVDTQSLSATEVRVSTPIYVRIAKEAPDPSWVCAFLDGDKWSREGVRLATAEELEVAFGAVADTTGVWCATLHLSIFGAFIDILLDCTCLAGPDLP